MDPAVWQQATYSSWVKTLEQKGGNYNWIPTQTLFSTADMTVTPQINASLAGSQTYIAGNMSGGILVQAACPNLNTAHNYFLVANFAYKVIQLALESSKKYVTISEVQQAVTNGTIDCSITAVSAEHQDTEQGRQLMLLSAHSQAPNANISMYNTSIGLVSDFAAGDPRVIAQVYAEPLLRPYVLNAPNNQVHDA